MAAKMDFFNVADQKMTYNFMNTLPMVRKSSKMNYFFD
jgi:hypothetical protein